MPACSRVERTHDCNREPRASGKTLALRSLGPSIPSRSRRISGVLAACSFGSKDARMVAAPGRSPGSLLDLCLLRWSDDDEDEVLRMEILLRHALHVGCRDRVDPLH